MMFIHFDMIKILYTKIQDSLVLLLISPYNRLSDPVPMIYFLNSYNQAFAT